jgi:hypothetical protein
MVMTYKQGLLAFSFIAAVSSGCTYNEDDLRAGRHDDSGTVDLSPGAGDLPVIPETDAGSGLDAGGIEAAAPDGLGTTGDAQLDSSGVDAGVGGEIDGGTDASVTRRDGPTTLRPDASDDQSITVSPLDASDLPGIDSTVDVSGDVSGIDGRGLDGGRILITLDGAILSRG